MRRCFVFFDPWSAAAIFLSDAIFWFLTTIYVKSCKDNDFCKTMLVAGATNASDFISKYFAPQNFNNVIFAFLAAAAGTGLALWLEKVRIEEKGKFYFAPLKAWWGKKPFFALLDIKSGE